MTKGPIVKKAVGNELGWRRIRGYVVPYNKALGVDSYFSNLIVSRIRKEKPCNCIFVGEPGISKTYSAISLARYIQPSFNIKNIVMSYAEFMEDMISLRQGKIIVYDEPEYDVGHRTWMESQNKALVSTMRSGRFKVHPIFMPVINKRLLDKVIRENLVQFMINITARGEGSVYFVKPSQFVDETRHEFICNLRISMLDLGNCQKRWCYSCKDIETCPLLRAQYERKRQTIQDARYEADLNEAKAASNKESPKEGFKRRLLEASENRGKYQVVQKLKGGVEKESFSVELIELGLETSPYEAQKIRRLLTTLSRDKIRDIAKTI